MRAQTTPSRPAILNENLTRRAVMLSLMTATLWGGNSIAIKIAMEGAPPIALAAIRFFLGGLTVLMYARFAGIPLKMRSEERGALAVLAVLFLVQIILLNKGTQYTTGGRSTILISTYPFFTAIFAHLFIPGDRLSRLKLFGMALSFAGILLLFGEELTLKTYRNLPGDLLVQVSAILLGARQIYTKRLTQGIHPCRLILWQALLSLPVFLSLSAAFEGGYGYRLDARIVAAILYQGLVVAGICFIIEISQLRRFRASRLSVFGFLTPVAGVLLSSVLLAEAITGVLVTSMILVGAGIAVVNREE
jgi:drug/metabolite transporter (DMT)-like permease